MTRIRELGLVDDDGGLFLRNLARTIDGTLWKLKNKGLFIFYFLVTYEVCKKRKHCFFGNLERSFLRVGMIADRLMGGNSGVAGE